MSEIISRSRKFCDIRSLAEPDAVNPSVEAWRRLSLPPTPAHQATESLFQLVEVILFLFLSDLEIQLDQ